MIKTKKGESNPPETCTPQNKMKSSLQTFSFRALPLLSALTLITTNYALGAVIASDPLTYAGTRNITSASPTVYSAVGSDAFSVGDPYSTFQQTSAGTSQIGGAAQLDLAVGAIQSNMIYTLSVTESASSDPYAQAYLGFGPTSGGSEFYNFGGATLEIGHGGGGKLDTTDGGYTVSNSNTTLASTNTLKLVLNTSSANWVVTASINGGTATSFTYTNTIGETNTDNPTGLNSVYIATPGESAFIFTNLSLSAVSTVPEPSALSLLLLGAGLTGICLRRRSLRSI